MRKSLQYGRNKLLNCATAKSEPATALDKARASYDGSGLYCVWPFWGWRKFTQTNKPRRRTSHPKADTTRLRLIRLVPTRRSGDYQCGLQRNQMASDPAVRSGTTPARVFYRAVSKFVKSIVAARRSGNSKAGFIIGD